MEAARTKLVTKRQGVKGTAVVAPTDLELQVAKSLYDLQNSSNEVAGELRSLQIYGVREVDVTKGQKALVVVVPVPQLKAWRKIQSRVGRELEKKLGGERSIVFIAFRRIMGKSKRGSKTVRPRSRTLTAVHENWLEDLVYPTEIVGKRMRVKTDGSRLIKVLLDPKDQTVLEAKLDTFAAIYRKLTGKDVVFDFPVSAGSEEEARRK